MFRPSISSTANPWNGPCDTSSWVTDVRRFYLGLWVAPLLAAQTQPTFYAAYLDGLDAERLDQWSAAAGAYRRAIELRPASATQVLIYGNNLLKDYAPYTHLARCLLELGDIEAAQSALGKAAHFGEPRIEREAIARAISRRALPAPSPKETVLAPPPVDPASRVPNLPPPPASESQVQAIPTIPLPVTPSAPGPLPSVPSQPKIERASQPDARILVPSQPASAPAHPPEVQGKAGVTSMLKWPAGILLALSVAFLYRRRQKRTPEESSFKDPEQLGPYRIERLLGRGGFASTYLAH